MQAKLYKDDGQRILERGWSAVSAGVTDTMGETATTHASADIRRLQERLRVLTESSRAFAGATTDYQNLLDTVAQQLSEVVGDTCAVMLLSDDATGLVPAAIHAPSPELVDRIRASLADAPLLLAHQPLARRVIDSGEPVLIPRLEPGQLGKGAPDEHVAYENIADIHSLLIVALRLHGKLIGILTLSRFRHESPPFDDQDRDLAETLALQAALAVGSARAFAEAKTARDLVETAKKELLQSQSRFSHLAESGLLGIVVGALDGRLLEVNDTLASMLGYERAELLSPSFNWSDLTPPEWKDVDARAIRELEDSRFARLREKQYIRKDGERIWVIAGSSVIEGTRTAISFVLDVTDRKNTALKLEQLRVEAQIASKFRALVEAAPDALIIVDAEGHITLVNAQAERLFGYTRDELVGQLVELLIPDRFKHRHPEKRTAYFSSAKPRPMGSGLELFGRRKDGSELPIEISLAPIQTEHGLLVASAIRDVSERKQNDEQRFRLAAIVESSHDAIIGTTLSGEITSWNHGAELLFGYPSAEAVGRNVTMLVPPDRKTEEALLNRLKSGLMQQVDTVRCTKTEARVDVSVTSSPVYDSRGNLVGASKVARDITERKQNEAALQRSRETAEAASRELESFSYSVAHDLRAPLRGMNGFAQVLLSDYGDKLDADGRDWLQEILSNARRMGELIDALLSLSRLTRGAVKPEPVDLSAMARAVLAKLALTDPMRKVDAVVERNVSAEADPILTRALLDNLIGNAWKFCGKRDSARIDVGVTEKNGEDVCFVRDNGAGFDMAYVDKLFTPFQRLHSAAEFPGTGIGLANVQRIVHRHGGKIWAEGEVGRGATFYFTLPSLIHGASA